MLYCVWLSLVSSFIVRTLNLLALIRLSCLHFGQYRGKWSTTVSARSFVRVFFPHFGQIIQSDDCIYHPSPPRDLLFIHQFPPADIPACPVQSQPRAPKYAGHCGSRRVRWETDHLPRYIPSQCRLDPAPRGQRKQECRCTDIMHIRLGGVAIAVAAHGEAVYHIDIESSRR